MDLTYCPKCGKLFNKNFRDVCNNCHLELEKDYEKCVEHLRKNKGLGYSAIIGRYGCQHQADYALDT